MPSQNHLAKCEQFGQTFILRLPKSCAKITLVTIREGKLLAGNTSTQCRLSGGWLGGRPALFFDRFENTVGFQTGSFYIEYGIWMYEIWMFSQEIGAKQDK